MSQVSGVSLFLIEIWLTQLRSESVEHRLDNDRIVRLDPFEISKENLAKR